MKRAAYHAQIAREASSGLTSMERSKQGYGTFSCLNS